MREGSSRFPSGSSPQSPGITTPVYVPWERAEDQDQDLLADFSWAKLKGTGIPFPVPTPGSPKMTFGNFAPQACQELLGSPLYTPMCMCPPSLHS